MWRSKQSSSACERATELKLFQNLNAGYRLRPPGYQTTALSVSFKRPKTSKMNFLCESWHCTFGQIVRCVCLCRVLSQTQTQSPKLFLKCRKLSRFDRAVLSWSAEVCNFCVKQWNNIVHRPKCMFTALMHIWNTWRLVSQIPKL